MILLIPALLYKLLMNFSLITTAFHSRRVHNPTAASAATINLQLVHSRIIRNVVPPFSCDFPLLLVQLFLVRCSQSILTNHHLYRASSMPTTLSTICFQAVSRIIITTKPHCHTTTDATTVAVAITVDRYSSFTVIAFQTLSKQWMNKRNCSN